MAMGAVFFSISLGSLRRALGPHAAAEASIQLQMRARVLDGMPAIHNPVSDRSKMKTIQQAVQEVVVRLHRPARHAVVSAVAASWRLPRVVRRDELRMPIRAQLRQPLGVDPVEARA